VSAFYLRSALMTAAALFDAAVVLADGMPAPPPPRTLRQTLLGPMIGFGHVLFGRTGLRRGRWGQEQQQQGAAGGAAGTPGGAAGVEMQGRAVAAGDGAGRGDAGGSTATRGRHGSPRGAVVVTLAPGSSSSSSGRAAVLIRSSTAGPGAGPSGQGASSSSSSRPGQALPRSVTVGSAGAGGAGPSGPSSSGFTVPVGDYPPSASYGSYLPQQAPGVGARTPSR
jgi:hypothetical protein